MQGNAPNNLVAFKCSDDDVWASHGMKFAAVEVGALVRACDVQGPAQQTLILDVQ